MFAFTGSLLWIVLFVAALLKIHDKINMRDDYDAQHIQDEAKRKEVCG
jgi:hypothetical protein